MARHHRRHHRRSHRGGGQKQMLNYLLIGGALYFLLPRLMGPQATVAGLGRVTGGGLMSNPVGWGGGYGASATRAIGPGLGAFGSGFDQWGSRGLGAFRTGSIGQGWG